MNQEAAIKVDSVSKAFKLPHEKQSSVKNLFINFFRKKRTFERQHVLHDVSIEIKKGEFFGIVGRNGSGKSTLLKLLAGIYSPDKGVVTIDGKLTPFIELGVGFNPELTGRENVYLNGALLGFSDAEMRKMYDSIVEFAELGKFMDQKLKNYSSGMQVRLAFSIAIRAESDILLIDEVLAVGDQAFQRKCLDIFEQYKANKQTVVFVTHDMDTVRKFCTRAMLVDKGEVVFIGDPGIAADKYSKLNQDVIDGEVLSKNKITNPARHLKARILGMDLSLKSSFLTGEKMMVDLNWDGLSPSDIESIGVNIMKLSGEHVTGINSRFSRHSEVWKKRGQIMLEFELNVAPGKYYLYVVAFKEEGKPLESIVKGPKFSIVKSDVEWSGLIELPHKWHESTE